MTDRHSAADRLQPHATGAIRSPAGVAGAGYSRDPTDAGHLSGAPFSAVADRQLQRSDPVAAGHAERR